MVELTVRLLSSAVGYASLVLMLRSPEPVRSFALYLPSSILVTLALDLGRGETALRQGLRPRAMRRARVEMVALSVVGGASILFLPFSDAGDRVKAVFALVVSGALQTYVDLFLRVALFTHRRSLHLYVYMFVLNCLNVTVAGAVALGILAPGRGLPILVLLPVASVTVFERALQRVVGTQYAFSPVANEAPPLGSALWYRFFPPAIYTAYAATLSRLTPELAASARAFYFVFGFMHTRRMAREATRSDARRTFVVLFAFTVLLSVPVVLFGRGPQVFDRWSIVACTVITGFTAAVFSWFLNRYAHFIDAVHREKDHLRSAASDRG